MILVQYDLDLFLYENIEIFVNLMIDHSAAQQVS
jgi:hypothetical protein